MRVLAVVHQPDAGPGVFAEAVAAAGDELVEWAPPRDEPPALDGLAALMVFGGAMHVDQDERHPWLREDKALLRAALERKLPVLGVCLGAQLLAEAGGGGARRAGEPEIGWHAVTLTEAARGDPLLGPLPGRFEAFQWHSYELEPPAGASALARSGACLQAYRFEGLPAWGLQFHAEVTRENALAWVDDYRSDEDAVRVGLDAEALRAETERRIGDWNELGRGLAARFLDAASGYSGVT